ncbi:hypothetical protein ACPA9J_16810 [Pseudomonas aeruginosa]
MPESQINVRFYGERYPLVARQQRRQPCAQPPGHRAPVARGGGRAGDGSAEAEDKPAPPRGRTCRTRKPPAASASGKPTV